MGRLEVAEQKMIRKIKASKQKWIDNITSADTYEKVVDNLYNLAKPYDSSLTKAKVKEGLIAKGFKDFQNDIKDNADELAEKMISNAIRGIESGKWKKEYLRSLGANV